MAEATAFLDRLGALHAQATPGPWEATDPRADGGAYIDTVKVRLNDGSAPWVGHTHRAADAAAIVAEHNASPRLIAAVRAAYALAEEMDDLAAAEEGAGRVLVASVFAESVDRIRAALDEALEAGR